MAITSRGIFVAAVLVFIIVCVTIALLFLGDYYSQGSTKISNNLLQEPTKHLAMQQEAYDDPGQKTEMKDKSKIEYGYILAGHFSDQMTAGSVNILTLQCWASSFGDTVKVVEPMIRDGSHFGLELSLLRNITSEERNGPRLFDIFDAQNWLELTSGRRYAGFVTWDEFLTNAPRKIIIVGHACTKIDQNFHDAVTKFALDNDFKVVREVCTKGAVSLHAKKYTSLIYADNRPHDTVVVFQLWGGVSSEKSVYREAMTGLSRCERRYHMNFIPQSQRIERNGLKYIEKYLHSTSGYVAVMIRFEQYFRRCKLWNYANQIHAGSNFVRSILNIVQALRVERGFKEVFLAMDSGKYGSSYFRTKNNTATQRLIGTLFNGLYGDGSLSYKEWESSFGSVSDFTKPGYVGMLQLNIASNAKVLLLAGGGSFQSLALRMYKYKHSRSHRRDVYVIRKC